MESRNSFDWKFDDCDRRMEEWMPLDFAQIDVEKVYKIPFV